MVTPCFDLNSPPFHSFLMTVTLAILLEHSEL